jgi:hypothetical protein
MFFIKYYYLVSLISKNRHVSVFKNLIKIKIIIFLYFEFTLVFALEYFIYYYILKNKIKYYI